MSFWSSVTLIGFMVAAVLGRAVLRGAGRALPARDASDVSVYRAQLAEVERDVARGVLQAAEAERVRAEVARRLLAADAAVQDAKAQRDARPWMPILLICALVLGSAGLYMRLGAPGYGDMALKDRIAFAEDLRRNRPDQAVAEASLPAWTQPEGLTPQHSRLLNQLREAVAQRPDDLQGHELLAEQEARVGNFSAAAKAQTAVLRIKGDAALVADVASLGELLILAAGGYVSPQAEIPLRQTLVQDPTNGTARYYLGLMLMQTGRPDQAFRLWDALLRKGPPEAPWINPILTQIESAAVLAGVNYSVPAIGAGSGPSAEDIENASDMTPEDRMEMIGGMVAGLSDRLAREGGPVQDWARLITSLGVLGETDRAAAIHANAVDVFAGDAGALDILQQAGERAGVAN
ncbi:c-type cytochrome biogenesis protein CcmI [Sulfitobacter sp. SK012]|uniref:c-type cytochrome biogenesis protein CcmI n=1 Tax=Sulfitobacter sp. SK012 TaxID=1389005 RepID=UPI000E0AA374|nr:c-type cytochrome biogenesis protein CcmI [Sulfitobacter sp. SK012]